MALSEIELEKQLMEAGNQLLSPPSSLAELLSALDRVECLLTRVEQSPSESMKKALSRSTKVLISDELLRHSDVDVKVSVASCISEITRITAPDAPYEDDQMKEVFQLIVSSFEKLDDRSSPSYIKRTTILETVAKVRSCVVMLDLECDALIVEMFQHFFRSIRDEHPEIVFSSMKTIMTLVLEESEDISLDLLSSILDVLKIENKEVLPVARQLGIKVIEKCTSKLKPYLLSAVKSCGASLGDYSKVVADACQAEAGTETVEPSDVDAARKNLAFENNLANAPAEKGVVVPKETLNDAPPSEEVGPTTAGSPKSVMSNSTMQKDIEDTSVGNGNSKEADTDTHAEVAEPNRTKVDSSDVEELTKSQTKPGKGNRRKGRKTSSLRSSSEPSDPTVMDGRKETVRTPDHVEKDGEDVNNIQSEDPVADTAKPAENQKESDAPVSLLKMADSKHVDVPSPSPSGNSADESRLKKDGRLEKEDDLVEEGATASDVDSQKDFDTKTASEGAGGSESKLHKCIGKKVTSTPDKEETVPSPANTSLKEDEISSKLDAKPGKQLGNKVEVGSQHEVKNKRGQGKRTPAKDLTKTEYKDEGTTVASPKSTGKPTKDESDVEKGSKSSSKRKHPGEEKASKAKVYGAELVGSKVKVWWPDDKKFYEGVVDSFDPVEKRHKVVYNDGDVELLKLEKEKWNLIDYVSTPDQRHSNDGERLDESAETQKAKKAKRSTDLGAKGGKTEATAKNARRSSSKSKATPESGRKQRTDNSKFKEEASKSIGKYEGKRGKSKAPKSSVKSSDSTPKSVGKSKYDEVDTPKGSNKLKQEIPKGAAKSKVKSPKRGNKSNTNSSSKGRAGSSAEEEESEDVEKSPEPTKALENLKGKPQSASKSQKSAKKRKRGTKD